MLFLASKFGGSGIFISMTVSCCVSILFLNLKLNLFKLNPTTIEFGK